MAYTPGTFSDSTMGDVIVAEQNFLTTSRISELNTSIVAGQAILAHQDPNIQVLGTGDGIGQKCVSAKASAIRACDLAVESTLTQSCAIDVGAELGSEVLDLTKSNIAKINFTVYDRDCHNAHSFAEKTAYASLVAKAKLEVKISQLLIARMSSIADNPLAAWFRRTEGTVSSDTFQVVDANWKSDLIGDIRTAAGITKMSSPLILNGTNFYTEAFLAQFKGIACCDNDSVLNGSGFQVYYDLHNMDSTLGGYFTLAIDKNAVIFWSAPDYIDMSPMLMTTDTYIWRDTLPRLQYFANGQMNPIYIDVRAKRVCEGSAVQSLSWGWNYEYIIRAAMVTNLANCDDRQGVLKIENIAGA